MEKKKIAFVCVHNSCRSQIAEALGNHLRGNDFECYSCGTETKLQINQDAVRLMKELYGIDMEEKQFSKTYDNMIFSSISLITSLKTSSFCPVGSGKPQLSSKSLPIYGHPTSHPIEIAN